MNGLLNIGERIPFQSLYLDNRVVSEATRVAASGKLNGRTVEQKLRDCSNGYALQYAVQDYLIQKGNLVAEATKKEYDLIINYFGETIYADVKGIFKPDAKTYSQTGWESSMVPKLGHDVIYLCFDCRSGEAIYEGWTNQNGFIPSKFYSGTYIYGTELNK
jgi:hypothetical protein